MGNSHFCPTISDVPLRAIPEAQYTGKQKGSAERPKCDDAMPACGDVLGNAEEAVVAVNGAGEEDSHRPADDEPEVSDEYSPQLSS